MFKEKRFVLGRGIYENITFNDTDKIEGIYCSKPSVLHCIYSSGHFSKTFTIINNKLDVLNDFPIYYGHYNLTFYDTIFDFIDVQIVYKTINKKPTINIEKLPEPNKLHNFLHKIIK